VGLHGNSAMWFPQEGCHRISIIFYQTELPPPPAHASAVSSAAFTDDVPELPASLPPGAGPSAACLHELLVPPPSTPGGSSSTQPS
jgi:hypothetical protein